MRDKRKAVAIVDGRTSRTYEDLLDLSSELARTLLRQCNANDMKDQCVAFLCPPSFDFVVMQWAVWRAGGVGVPMCTDHSVPELAYVLEDAKCDVALVHADYADILREAAKGLSCDVRKVDVFDVEERKDREDDLPPDVHEDRRAMMIYTSGTTGAPKGVVSTHGSLRAQITSLVDAWGWQRTDRILNVLPLHHVHGVVNM